MDNGTLLLAAFLLPLMGALPVSLLGRSPNLREAASLGTAGALFLVGASTAIVHFAITVFIQGAFADLNTRIAGHGCARGANPVVPTDEHTFGLASTNANRAWRAEIPHLVCVTVAVVVRTVAGFAAG